VSNCLKSCAKLCIAAYVHIMCVCATLNRHGIYMGIYVIVEHVPIIFFGKKIPVLLKTYKDMDL